MFNSRLLSHLTRGADLAPPSNNNGAGIGTERIPKSAARVLDAARIRAEYRQKRARQQIDGSDANHDHAPKPAPHKKRRTDAGAGVEKGMVLAKGKRHPVDTIEIQPGESLKHFNR
jgi:acyl-CoA synthetase (NDP forming)